MHFDAARDDDEAVLDGLRQEGIPVLVPHPVLARLQRPQQVQSLAPAVPQTEAGFATEHNCAFWTALEAA